MTSLMAFGCFVQLEGLRGRHEGLVHVSEVCYLYTTTSITHKRAFKSVREYYVKFVVRN